MRSSIPLAALLLCGLAAGCVDATPPTPNIPMPEGAVVFDGSQVPAMLNQCSRAAPEAGEGTWRPDGADIVAFEAALPAAIAARKEYQERDLGGFPATSVRQYVGIVRSGKRFIYGNFARNETHAGEDWERRVIGVCDGGPSFFGAEFDVAAGRVTHLAFNGIA